MGTGSSRGDDRAVAAAEMAISSPLLEASIDGAHGVLLSIQGGSDLGLFEINEAAQLVSNSAAVDANIIFGAVIDDALGDEVRVTVIAAGLDEGRNSRVAASVGVADSGGSSFSSHGSSGASAVGIGGGSFNRPDPQTDQAPAAMSPPRPGPAVPDQGSAETGQAPAAYSHNGFDPRTPEAPRTPESPRTPETSGSPAARDYVLPSVSEAPASFLTAPVSDDRLSRSSRRGQPGRVPHTPRTRPRSGGCSGPRQGQRGPRDARVRTGAAGAGRCGPGRR